MYNAIQSYKNQAAAILATAEYDLLKGSVKCQTTNDASRLAEFLARAGYKAEQRKYRWPNPDRLYVDIAESDGERFAYDFATNLKFNSRSETCLEYKEVTLSGGKNGSLRRLEAILNGKEEDAKLTEAFAR